MAIKVRFTHDFSLFCVGASAFIVAAIAHFTAAPHWSQWIGFAALSVIILLVVQPLLGRFQAHRGRDADFNIIGEVATLTEPRQRSRPCRIRGSS
jgi:membrane protein implicated in regulation of membrane protease activity